MTINVPDDLASLFTEHGFQEIRNAFAMVKALRELNVQLVPAQGALALKPGQQNIKGDPPALILPLPLQLPAIADSTATAASCSAAINQLLASLRATGQMQG